MKKNLISLIALGFLVGCGGGGDSTTTTSNIDTINQENIDNNTTINNIESNTTISQSNLSIPTISEIDKNKFLDAINEARAEARDCNDGKGLVPAVGVLTWNDNLYNASYEHNYDMLNANYFEHEGSGSQYDISGIKLNKKSDPLDRVKNNGYLDGFFSYGVGENLAGGHSTIEHAVQDWLNSPPHCTNIMTSNFKDMGLSKVDNGNGGFLWTNVFGYRK